MNLGETVHLTKLKGEYRSRIYNKKKLVIYFFVIFIIFILLGIRIGYVMIFRSGIMPDWHRNFMREKDKLRQQEENWWTEMVWS